MRINKYVNITAIAFIQLLIIGSSFAVEPVSNELTWSVTKNGNILEIGYGSGTSFPQYVALDLTSSYMRLVYGPDSGWGTSIILLPSFWSQSSCQPNPCQRAPVTAQWRKNGNNLILTVKGVIGGINVISKVTFTPPTINSITARVKTTTTGSVILDSRVGEAFKPVMLSSMYDSSTQWDTQYAYAGKKNFPIPTNGWIVYPPISSKSFGLVGGTSSWKANAPTIKVYLDKPRQITGWATQDDNPNNDNVGYWCATDEVLPSWSYTITAMPAPLPSPSAGLWYGNGIKFNVSSDSSSLTSTGSTIGNLMKVPLALYPNAGGCSSYSSETMLFGIAEPTINQNSFIFSGNVYVSNDTLAGRITAFSQYIFTVNGIFDSSTSAHGTATIVNIMPYHPSCSFSWTASKQ